MSDQESNDEEEKELIHYSGNYGGITQESKFWDDFEEMGEKELLKLKIIKIKKSMPSFSLITSKWM